MAPRAVLLLALPALLASARLDVTAGPARLRDAALPRPAVGPHVGGGEVVLVLTVDESGQVGDVLTVRDTPPYTDLLRGVVGRWTFAPARDDTGGSIASRVLAVGVFRPPTTSGPAVGSPPRDLAPAPAGVPWPVSTVPPAYPVQALGDGTALVEAAVDADGPAAVRVLTASASVFGEAARVAAEQWRFRAGAAPAYAYLVFGFREPVTMGGPTLR
jgi:hypothetical protein